MGGAGADSRCEIAAARDAASFGDTFRSSAHCREHGALLDRIESVSDRLLFAQQMSLAEQSRAGAARAA